MYSTSPSDKPFPEDYNGDNSYNYVEGGFFKDIGSMFKQVGEGVGSAAGGILGGGAQLVGQTLGGTAGLVRGVGAGAGSIIKSPFEGLSSIFSVIKWPLVVIAGIVILALLYNFLKETPEDRAARMRQKEREEDRQYEREKQRAADRAMPAMPMGPPPVPMHYPLG